MGAYENALREEGNREDLLEALEKAWNKIEDLENQILSIQGDGRDLSW